MSAPESNWASWLAKADNDFLCIRNNLAAERAPWDAVCYHAQQAAEKMLKAFVVFHVRQPWKTHDLLALLGECVALDAAVGELADDCEVLNPYSVEVRYPDDLLEPDEAEARAAVAAAQRIHSFILGRLKPQQALGTGG
jgi:HEPN domain-containing protein